MPPDLRLNAATGQVTGLPYSAGSYDFTVSVTGADGCSGTALIG